MQIQIKFSNCQFKTYHFWHETFQKNQGFFKQWCQGCWGWWWYNDDNPIDDAVENLDSLKTIGLLDKLA